jgi:hypothetical protein
MSKTLTVDEIKAKAAGLAPDAALTLIRAEREKANTARTEAHARGVALSRLLSAMETAANPSKTPRRGMTSYTIKPVTT